MNMRILKFLTLTLLCIVFQTTYAGWTCYAADNKKHYWMSSGSTAARAMTIAVNFCKAFSPHPASCRKNKCVEK